MNLNLDKGENKSPTSVNSLDYYLDYDATEHLEQRNKKIKNIEVLLWHLMEGEIISLREFQHIKSGKNDLDKTKLLFTVLQKKRDFVSVQAIIAAFTETGNYDLIVSKTISD